MDTGSHPREPFRSEAAQSAEANAKAKAKELTHTARERALSAVDQGKDQLCSVLERAADSVQDDRLGAYASEYARRGAEFLRGRSADELLRSARRTFRSRPGLMLSACFVAGLALARFMKGAAGGAGDDGRFGERDLDAPRWGEAGDGGRGYGERGHGERSWSAPDPARDEAWRQGQP